MDGPARTTLMSSSGNAMTHVLLPLLILLAVTACGDREAAKPAVEAKTAAAREAAINRAEGEHSDHEEEEGDAIKLSQEEQRAAGIEVARVEPRAISERLVLTRVQEGVGSAKEARHLLPWDASQEQVPAG